jgi:hypothetical protein
MSAAGRVNIWKGALEPGLLAGAFLIIAQLVPYVLEMDHWAVTISLGSVGYIAIMVWLQSRFRDNGNGGFIKYGRALGSAVIIGVYASVVFSIYYLVFTQFIAPGFFEEQALKSFEMMKGWGIPENKIAEQLKAQEAFQAPLPLFFITIINMTLLAALLGLISSAFVLKKDPSKDF